MRFVSTFGRMFSIISSHPVELAIPESNHEIRKPGLQNKSYNSGMNGWKKMRRGREKEIISRFKTVKIGSVVKFFYLSLSRWEGRQRMCRRTRLTPLLWPGFPSNLIIRLPARPLCCKKWIKELREFQFHFTNSLCDHREMREHIQLRETVLVSSSLILHCNRHTELNDKGGLIFERFRDIVLYRFTFAIKRWTSNMIKLWNRKGHEGYVKGMR